MDFLLDHHSIPLFICLTQPSITSLFSGFVILIFFFFLSSYKQSALQLICVPTMTKGPVKNVSSVYMIKYWVNIATVFVCACFLHHCFQWRNENMLNFFFPLGIFLLLYIMGSLIRLSFALRAILLQCDISYITFEDICTNMSLYYQILEFDTIIILLKSWIWLIKSNWICSVTVALTVLLTLNPIRDLC